MASGIPRRILMAVLVSFVASSVTEAIPAFTKNAGEVCDYLKRISSRCPIPLNITDINAPLFKDSNLTPVVKQCRMDDGTVPAAINTDAGFQQWKISFLTFVSFNPRCGLLVDPKQISDEEIIKVLKIFLSWTPGIPGHNCALIRRVLKYIGDNVGRFLQNLQVVETLIKVLPTNLLKYILAVLPGGICDVFEHLNIFKPEQVSTLVDALAADCRSGTILSSLARCSRRDTPTIDVRAVAGSRQNRTARDPNVCIAPGAGQRCDINIKCIKSLCNIDLNNRNCTSPCAKLVNRPSCRPPSDTSIEAQCTRTPMEAKQVQLPDPKTATVEDLTEVVCCLLRRVKKRNLYPPEVLCRLDSKKIENKKCRTKFDEWQASYAPKCTNCTASSHTMALLSPNCSQIALKMAETTVDDLNTLIHGTKGRKMLFKLFRQIYPNLDLQLRYLVCIKGFLPVLTVQNVMRIGDSNLDPVLEEMMKCEQPPAIAKVLAILVKKSRCPVKMLIKSGSHLIQMGAMTDRCFESLQANEALEVCSIIMADRRAQVSKRKIKLLCKVLDNLPGDTTCILCPLKKRVLTQTQLTMVDPRPDIQALRCLQLRSVQRRQRNPQQDQELRRCKMCKMDANEQPRPGGMGGMGERGGMGGDFSWCQAEGVTLEQVLRAASRSCALPCEELDCFLKDVERLATAALQRNDTDDPYSNMRYLRAFLPGRTSRPTPVRPEDDRFMCRSRCRVMAERLKEHIVRRPPRQRREATCNTVKIIEGFYLPKTSVSSVLNLVDLNCLTPTETAEVITSRSLGLEEWSPDQARILLDKFLTSVGRDTVGELTGDELRNLGLILVVLTPDELKKIKVIDDNLFGLFGSSARWSRTQMRALVTRYLEQEMRTPGQLTVDDVLLLQNLLAGFTAQEISNIPTAAITGASAVLGALPLCDPNLLEALINHLIIGHGKVQKWDESQLAEYSNLLGALNSTTLNILGPTVVSYMPDNIWLYHMDEAKFNRLSDMIKAVVPDYQRELALQKIPKCDGVAERRKPDRGTKTIKISGANRHSIGLHMLFACIIIIGMILY